MTLNPNTATVDVFRSGQRQRFTWTVTVAGNFTVTRNAREVNGVNDVYTARARNLATGEICSARVVLPD